MSRMIEKIGNGVRPPKRLSKEMYEMNLNITKPHLPHGVRTYHDRIHPSKTNIYNPSYLLLHVLLEITKETYPHIMQTDIAKSWPIMTMVTKLIRINTYDSAKK